MAPRATTKRRFHQRHGASTSQHEYESRGSPALFDDGDDGPDKIGVLGFSLPNPVSILPSSIANNLTPTRLLLFGGIGFIFLAPLLDVAFREATSLFGSSSAADDNGIIGDALPHVTNDGKFHGRYPNSLLTLFYPYTLFRDVVLDQPVDQNDVPFFWHAHVSDEAAVKPVLTKCYGAELVELNTVEEVEKAKRSNLVATLVSQDRVGPGALKETLYNGQRKNPTVIASPHIREVAELFNQDNFGRMFSFYRHPIDYDLHPELKKKLPPEADGNNFMVRLLSNVHTGPLEFKQLGVAKQVIRQNTIAGTRDRMEASLFRFAKYYGWVPVGGKGTKESEDSDDALAKACIEELIKDVPGEKFADHNSPEWKVFYQANHYDCQLYEIARSNWRAHIQTIIPLTLQKIRAGEGDDQEKEDEKKEDEDEER
ncbi:hypothetical protein ACHAXT_008115 [Thalassiosira profunda]